MVSAQSVKKMPDKIIAHADKLAALGGFVGVFGGAETDPIQQLGYHVSRVLLAPRMPDFSYIAAQIPYVISHAILPVVVGMAIDYTDIGGLQKYGKALEKAGIGLAIGELAAHTLVASHNPRPSGATTGTVSKANIWMQSTSTGDVSTNAQKINVTASTPVALPSM